VDDPHDVAFGTYAAAIEVAHGRVDRAAGMDRLAVTWRAQLIIHARSATVIAVLRAAHELATLREAVLTH